MSIFTENRRLSILVATILALLLASFVLWSNYDRWFSSSNQNTESFSPYIESYTSGTISKEGYIRVRLASTSTFVRDVAERPDQNLIKLSPNIKGEVYWVDSKTIEFKPQKHLKPGEKYLVSFYLDKVVDVPKEFGVFKFEIKVLEPSFQIDIHGLTSQTSRSLDLMKLKGKVMLADLEENQNIEKIISAKLGGQSKTVKWTHEAIGKVSYFEIDSLLRTEQSQKIELIWDGQSISSSKTGKQEFEIPKLGEFKLLDIKSLQDPEQAVLVQFSDPLMMSQDLNGLFEIQGVQSGRFDIDGSEVKLYPIERLEGEYAFTVHPGIENIESKRTNQQYSGQVLFENRLPAVTIPGTGSILPGVGNLTFPFEAVNLKAVDVTIVRIFAKNVPQYFQVEYDNSYELRRVGQPILKKTIRLDTDPSLNLNRKNRFSLDIDQLVKTEPGAIYRVLIGFRKEYSVYPCLDNQEDLEEISEEHSDSYGYYRNEVDVDGYEDFWSTYDGFYPLNYDWNERDNPCHSSYYTQDRWAKRDLLASNIGLLAKRGNDQSMTILATHILTAEPIADAEIKILDFQQQIIQTGKTDAQGMVHFKDTKQPFLLIAEKDKEIGYLKLDEGNSLPLSRFDVSGEQVQEGLKGFIYTERGVWRPGDSLYVGFILEDKNSKLPSDHPVTFELRDARGRVFQKLTERKNLNGFYLFKTATSTQSPTGNWLAKIQVGGVSFQKSLKIETIIPNRLKIDLDFGNQKFLKSQGAQLPLRANWLFGATAGALQAKVDLKLSPTKTQFKNFENYTFDDPTKYYEQESFVYFEGPLNDQGQTVLDNKINKQVDAPGMLQAQFTTRVFEPGGSFSIDYQQIPFSPFQQYVGVMTPKGDRLSNMLLTDLNHELSIVMVDENGKPVLSSSQVQVEFYKIQWSWWWNQDNNLSNFSHDQYNQLLKKETITLESGKAKWKFRVDYPDWGRYLVRIKDLKGGHSTAQTMYIDWPGWSKREQVNNPTEASMLSFTSDKTNYKVGEKVNLTIPTSVAGRGLISIENGSKVLQQEWIKTQEGQTTYSFKVTAEMSPNIYVNITLLQPYGQTINDLPLRMYGVIPLTIEDPETILQPGIKMSKTIRPETPLSIEVFEKKGKNMTYTLALVDEGLLDLTRFRTPDPHRAFYAREALGVKTWDLYDRVLGAWGGELQRILGIGGDADMNRNLNPAKANRFQAVVKMLGPFQLKGNSKKIHKIEIPNYVGSLKAMVVAGHEGAYGFAEETVSVKKPLMLLATLPRVIGPHESFSLPITVFAMDPKIKNVQVQLRTSKGLKVIQNNQGLSFNQEGEKVVLFEIETAQETGVEKIEVIAQSGGEKATYEVEIDVRNPNPFQTVVDEIKVDAGKFWQGKLETLGQSDQETILVEASTLPPINLHKRLQYLIRYPHGCLEQITSGVFPQLYLHKIVKLNDNEQKRIQNHIQVGLNRLKSYQLSSGGFSYWPGNQEADEWSTNYAGHFVIEAKRSGYALPPGMENNWVRFQSDRARKWSPNQYNWYGADLIQAYRLYTLALVKKPEMGAMNRLKELPNLSNEAAWRLAAAYQLAGQGIVAKQIIKSKKTTAKKYDHAGPTFGSEIRDQAMMLETLSLLDQKNQATSLVQNVANSLGSDHWMSTQTTAYALIGIAQYMGKEIDVAPFAYTLGKTEVKVDESHYLYQIPISKKDFGQNLKINNTGNKSLFLRVIREGQPQVPEKDFLVKEADLRSENKYLSLQVRYLQNNGQILDPRSLTQGEDFFVEITVRNTGQIGGYENLALTQIFPSGWEILQIEGQVTYLDKRDDRILYYFNLGQNETKKLKVQVNATYSGHYFRPGVTVEAMYDNRIQAHTGAGWIEVQKK